MSVVTRFAPSPTGFLHIGGARTALFCWLFAKANKGKFLLRVEDTDRERSTKEAVDAIMHGMHWLGLDYDGEPIYQYSRTKRHQEVVAQMIREGKAYKCSCSKERLDEMRAKAVAAKVAFKYDGKCKKEGADESKPCVVRMAAPKEGEVVIDDKVRGKVVIKCDQLDDIILLRSDGTPTYMLAVVVDDHDMAVTHVIRGEDHLTNTSKQVALYQAMGWDLPVFAHIPLIHGPDGAKLSKRHGALGVDAYEEMGILPEAMRNYLLRLGWSHGDDEVIKTEQAIKWFNLESIGKSPSRFDISKLEHLNGIYIREAGNEELLPYVESRIINNGFELDDLTKERISKGISGVKQRAKTINEIASQLAFYIKKPAEVTDKAEKALSEAGDLLHDIKNLLLSISDWNGENLEQVCKSFAEQKELKLGQVMGVIRAAITSSHASPSMFEAMEILGKDETIARL